MTQDDQDSEFVPLLEVPPAPEMPTQSGLLFENDSATQASSKLAAVEGMLALLTKDCSFDEFSRELLLLVMKIVRSEAGSIFEVDQDKQCFFFRTSVGQASDRLGRFTVPLGKGIVGHVAESRLPLVVSNVEDSQVHLKTIGDAVGFEARNLVAVPMIIRGRVFGVLEVLNRVGEENYTQADVELLSYVCEAASRAVEVRLMLGWALQHAASEEGRRAA